MDMTKQEEKGWKGFNEKYRNGEHSEITLDSREVYTSNQSKVKFLNLTLDWLEVYTSNQSKVRFNHGLVGSLNFQTGWG